MKTGTKDNILAYISKNASISAKEIIQSSGIKAAAVFRHLKNLQAGGLIYKVGKPPQVRYYAYINAMENKSKIIIEATNWAVSGAENFVSKDFLCETRDVYQARADRVAKTVNPVLKNENLALLLSAMVGEIGNNSFDHNIGQWKDQMGIFFRVDSNERVIILADRGQGVLQTLRKARPQIADDVEALTVAFNERISGRAPEQRGNGLKFVKKVIVENNFQMEYYSGEAYATINSAGMKVAQSKIVIPGTLCIIYF